MHYYWAEQYLLQAFLAFNDSFRGDPCQRRRSLANTLIVLAPSFHPFPLACGLVPFGWSAGEPWRLVAIPTVTSRSRCVTGVSRPELRIGSFCSIADEIQVFLGGNHRLDWVTTYPFPAFDELWPSRAGHLRAPGDEWRCGHRQRCLDRGASRIMSGVTDRGRGRNRSLQLRCEGCSALCASSPATLRDVLRHRFDAETIEKLLAIRWWDWSDEKSPPTFSSSAAVTSSVSVESQGTRRRAEARRRLLGSRR